MNNKLDLLKKYIELQAIDESLWFVDGSASEYYLQQELRKVAWLIEEANEFEIQEEIEKRVFE